MPVILAETPRYMSVEIRPAQLQDLPRIMQIEASTFGGQWDFYQYKASLNDVFLVAVETATAEITGFLVACCCKVARRGIILRLAVDPDFQGKGIATQLIQRSLEELGKKDLDEVELDVDVLKSGAQHLYDKMGFKVKEVFSFSEEDDEAFYIMRRKLD